MVGPRFVAARFCNWLNGLAGRCGGSPESLVLSCMSFPFAAPANFPLALAAVLEHNLYGWKKNLATGTII